MFTAIRRAALCTTVLVLAALLLPDVSAYTSAAVRSSSSGVFQVVDAQPAGGMQPFVYCSAPNVTVSRNATATIPVTCANGFAHSVSLSVTYSASGAVRPPAYSPASPLALTVPANGQATTNITVTTAGNTTRTTYTLSYAAATSGTQPVDISGLAFSSTLAVQ